MVFFRCDKKIVSRIAILCGLRLFFYQLLYENVSFRYPELNVNVWMLCVAICSFKSREFDRISFKLHFNTQQIDRSHSPWNGRLAIWLIFWCTFVHHITHTHTYTESRHFLEIFSRHISYYLSCLVIFLTHNNIQYHASTYNILTVSLDLCVKDFNDNYHTISWLSYVARKIVADTVSLICSKPWS